MNGITLLRYPDPAITTPSIIVDRFGFDLAPVTDELRRIRDDCEAHGVDAFALAAPQIGVHLRVFLWRDSHGTDLVVCNPEVKAVTGHAFAPEQCLSFLGPRQIVGSKHIHAGGLVLQVERPLGILVRYQDEEGKWSQVEASGTVARMFCHEIDHLNGITILDRVTRPVRKQALRDWAKMHPDIAGTIEEQMVAHRTHPKRKKVRA